MSGIGQRLAGIARRKEALAARVQAQRITLADSFMSLSGPLGAADRGLDAVRFLRDRPLLVAALIAALIALRRRRVLAMVGGAVSLWRLYRALAPGPGGRG